MTPRSKDEKFARFLLAGTRNAARLKFLWAERGLREPNNGRYEEDES